MKNEDRETPLLQDPHAPLEKAYILEYLRGRGHTLESLRDLPEAEARRLMTEASLFASARLTEMETRAQFVHDVHGVAPPL